MAKKRIDSLAVYITNVCGMACDGCVSFNNYVLKGHYEWHNSREKIHRWKDLIDPRQITIIGGEPFLHPSLREWVEGVHASFVDCPDIRVVTGLTGQHLLRYKDTIRQCIDNGVSVQISVHDPNWWNLSIETARSILEGMEYREFSTTDGGSFPLKVVDYRDVDNNLLLTMMELWSFFPNAQKEVRQGVIYLHENDPIKAHELCYCRSSQYMVDGEIYKCALTAVSKVMVNQLPLDSRSHQLLSQVKGIDPFELFDLDFSNPIPQCGLCSVKMENLIPIYPISMKKPKI